MLASILSNFLVVLFFFFFIWAIPSFEFSPPPPPQKNAILIPPLNASYSVINYPFMNFTPFFFKIKPYWRELLFSFIIIILANNSVIIVSRFNFQL